MSENDGIHKRKRDGPDAGDEHRLSRHAHNGGIQGIQGYETHGLTSNGNDLSNIDQALLQHVGGAQNGVTDDNAMTAKAALAAHQPQSKYPPPDASFDNNALAHNLTFGGDVDTVPMPGVHGHNSTADAVYAARQAQNMGQGPKPAVGSAEWHTIRKNNHKEVERRRRETINEGINELAKMVPGNEKAKGSILQRTIAYIQKLQEDSKEMEARWDTANMTTNHALTEISTQNAKLKNEVNRRGEIALKWIQRARDAGLDFNDYDDQKDLGSLDVDEHQG